MNPVVFHRGTIMAHRGPRGCNCTEWTKKAGQERSQRLSKTQTVTAQSKLRAAP